MRLVAIGLLSAGIIAGLALGAAAKNPSKPHKHKRLAHAPSRVETHGGRGQDQWYERDVNKLPFGSSIWWDQMLRENRLTCCN